MFHIQSEKFPCVIETQEICKNVFVPTTIVHKKESWIRVLNIDERSKMMRTDQIRTKSIDEFDICVINKNNQYSRMDHLAQVLNAKMPNHVKSKLLPLCLEFADIFHLPDDKPTDNNFYTQKLNLRDNQPVFVKNYRLPQSQKTEIHQQVKNCLMTN